MEALNISEDLVPDLSLTTDQSADHPSAGLDMAAIAEAFMNSGLLGM